MKRIARITVGVACFSMAILGAGVPAASEQLSCTLTDTAAQLGSEHRQIAVTFDDAAKTLTAQDAGQAYAFRDVSISSISVSGDVNDVSLAIDRSSFGIVLQHYEGSGKTAAVEFGQCQPANSTDKR